MDITFYQNKLDSIKTSTDGLKKKVKQLSMLRLLFFMMGIVLLYWLMKISSTIAILVFLLFILLFFIVLVLQNKATSQLKDFRLLTTIYENEIALLNNEPNTFGNGNEYLDNIHPYSSDLDIFGPHSIFESMNRMVTVEGKNKLAGWLIDHGDRYNISAILKRHQAIEELSHLEHFREKMLIRSFVFSKEHKDRTSILKWFEGFKFNFLKLQQLKLIFTIASLVLICLVPLAFIYDLVYIILFASLIVSTAVYFFFFRKVNELHSEISKQGSLFSNYSKLVNIISQEKFNSALLQSISLELDRPDHIASELKKLSKLIGQLDYRLNPYLAFFLNLFFFWDIRKCIQIEQWLKKNISNVQSWIDPIAEIDALLSLGIYWFNHPEYTFPELVDVNEVLIKGESMGHPLIDPGKRVDNNYDMKGTGKFDIITGSNMAGKTTFLRTIGVNTILAFAGAPVCAKKLVLSPFRIMTYMRIADSLEYNLSTFHAEIKRIRAILDFSESQEPCLLLLDELLRGTNSMDRATGTKALIKQLSDSGANGLISTHDLGLTEIENELSGKIRNFHFDIVNVENDLDFDYKLKPGVSKTTNAAMLLKKIGLELTD